MSQNVVPIFPKVVIKPTLEIEEIEPVPSVELIVAESEEPPPLVPPHTADSEVLNLSTGQPPNNSQNEVAYSV